RSDRGGAPQLALPARPAHRRLPGHRAAVHRLKARTSRGPSVMPAEWERHDATWLVWPQNTSDWPGRFGPIPWVYAEIIRKVAGGERVELLVDDAATERRARRILERAGAPLGQ